MTAKWISIKTPEDLKSIPSIFNTEVHPKASDKYSQVCTLDILEGAERFGWKPTFAAGNTSDVYGVHTIKLEHPEYVMPTGDKIQMVVNNSHNLQRRFSLDAGVYRLVCSNGLIMAIHQFASIRKRHMGIESMELLEHLLITIDGIGEVAPSVKRMSEIDLTRDQREEIAIEALLSRLGEEELVETVDLFNFLSPKRNADSGTDLWTTYNLVQEKIIHGDFEYDTRNSNGVEVTRKARSITGFQKDLSLNKKLYDIATKYM